MNLILVALAAVCCLSALMVTVVAAAILYRRSQASGEGAAAPEAASAQAAIDGPPASGGSPFPASASVDLTGSGPDRFGGSIGDEVEDFDEDGPTTLVDTIARRPDGLQPGGLPPQSPYAPTKSRLPTEPIRKPPTDPVLAPTERLQVPRRPASPVRPPRTGSYGHVPAPDEPPPLPGSHGGSGPLPASRRLQLDPSMVPDTSALQPGATIIPPDDWNDDYIDDDEADETMLMARPPLPPKK